MPAQASSTFGKRLKQARDAVGLSQKQLGILAGLDEFVASTRINRYERGVHEPDAGIAMRLAGVLNVPRAYLYADDDAMAELILAYARAGKAKQRLAAKALIVK